VNVTPPEHVVVVGAGLAGSKVVQELKRLGFEGRITLIGAEEHPPYDRPPLSKQVLAGAKEPDDVLLARPETLAEAGVDLKLGRRATHIAAGSVTLDDGEVVEGDAVVVATGVGPRVPDWLTVGGPIHVLRTREDSLRLRAAIAEASSLLVLGGGFIGAEVAATAVAAGLDVTLVEARDSLLAGALPAEVGEVVAELHRQRGVTILTGTPVESVVERDGRAVVVLADGSELTADIAVVGFGTFLDAGPIADLLGSDQAGGIRTDAQGRVDGMPGVYAVGDVAAWYDERLGRHYRREHWSSASEQGARVAHLLAGAELPPFLANSLPYFWSDQYDVKVQVVGWPALATAEGWVAHEAGDKVVYEYTDGDRLVAAVTIGSPRLVGPLRKRLTDS